MTRRPRFGMTSVFSKLFASVVLTLVLFAAGMVTLMNLVHNNSADARWEVLAKQIVSQIDPFVDELDNATTMNELLQARFMLAVVKRSFDVFDESLQAKMGLYDRNGNLLIQTDDSDLPKQLPDDP
ncbi:MAG TPA: sensor histidine kinase, partial [Psychrobacter sp.]|nr:sensor histidine kinase [Psychrobacter sp.]